MIGAVVFASRPRIEGVARPAISINQLGKRTSDVVDGASTQEPSTLSLLRQAPRLGVSKYLTLGV